MNRITPHLFTVLVAALALTASHASAAFVAYNDFGGAVSPGNVSNISGLGNDRGGSSVSPSGSLVKLSDGTPTGAILTYGGPTFLSWNFKPGQGTPAGGTDADTLFNGITGFDPTGMSDGTGAITLDITGLDKNKTYDIALYATRNLPVAGNTRNHVFTITDITSFTNISSAGAAKSTVALTDDTTTYDSLTNTANGYVARFGSIVTGDDGDLRISISSVGNLGLDIHLNALRLEESAGGGGDPGGDIPTPAALPAGLALIGLLAARRRR